MTTDLVPTCTPDWARALTDRIKIAVEATWQLVVEAYHSQAWAVLGYSSWDDYCTREFGTSRLRLPREDRQETVMSLHDAGLSVRAIEAVTGVSRKTVIRDIHQVVESPPPDDESVEVYDEPELAKTIGIDGKTYPKTKTKKPAKQKPGPEWRGKPITPDLKDPIFGRGITANDKAERQISLVTSAAEHLTESAFTPEELKAAARPGDIERWTAELRTAVNQLNRYIKQLEK